MAVRSVNLISNYILHDKDFKQKYYFEILPRRIGTDKSTLKACKFYDYSPFVFN